MVFELHLPFFSHVFLRSDPNESRCAVPDERYDYLCEMWQPASRYPAYLNVTDIAGLVRGASEGAGLGNAFLSHIGAVDGIFHVIRAFDNDEVIHVDDSVDPIRDLDTIQMELCKKDLQYLDKVGRPCRHLRASRCWRCSVALVYGVHREVLVACCGSRQGGAGF